MYTLKITHTPGQYVHMTIGIENTPYILGMVDIDGLQGSCTLIGDPWAEYRTEKHQHEYLSVQPKKDRTLYFEFDAHKHGLTQIAILVGMIEERYSELLGVEFNTLFQRIVLEITGYQDYTHLHYLFGVECHREEFNESFDHYSACFNHSYLFNGSSTMVNISISHEFNADDEEDPEIAGNQFIREALNKTLESL